MSSTALVLALSATAAAFAPPGGRLTPAIGATVARSTAVPIYTDPTPAWDGLKLPDDSGKIETQEMPEVEDEVNKFLGASVGAVLAGGAFGGAWADIVGKPKTAGSLDAVQKMMPAFVPGMDKMPASYASFGGPGADWAKTLCLLVETNPFFAASLTKAAGGGFELTTEGDSYYARVMRTSVRKGPRVNVKFGVKPGGAGLFVEGYDVIAADGKKVEPTENDAYYMQEAAFGAFFVAQSLHGSIHIYHYVLTNALEFASKDYDMLHNWAEEYLGNVNSKYDAVTSVLCAPDTGLVTSARGLGGSMDTLAEMKVNIGAWGACGTTTEFLDAWLSAPRRELEEAGVLTEWFKHVDLASGFAVAAASAVGKKGRAIAKTNSNLDAFIRGSGAWDPDANGVADVQSWIALMAVTGTIHGCTLSFTRLAAVPEFWRFRAIEVPVWSPDDAVSATIGLSTIVGIQEDKHVCGNCLAGLSDDEITYGRLQRVLNQYERQTTMLKEVYQAKISARDDFDDYGFLLTDFAPDFFDGKQLTLAVYV